MKHSNLQKAFSIIQFFFVLLTGCTTENKKPDLKEYTMAGDVYHNHFFNFKLTIPVNYIKLDEDQVDRMNLNTVEILEGSDFSIDQVGMGNNQFNTILAVFKYELGAGVDFNPSFQLITQNVKDFPGIKNGGDYLFHVSKLYDQTFFGLESIDDRAIKVNINGLEFHNLNATFDFAGQIIYQNSYAVKKGDYIMNGILTFTDDVQKNELEEMVKSIEFFN
jgi:hypothetical protein